MGQPLNSRDDITVRESEPPTPVDDADVTILPERFELLGQLGAGGMGCIFRAFDRLRGEEVALKTPRLSKASASARFKNEFRALANLRHPNLVSHYELIAEGDQLYLAMELIRGVDWVTFAHLDHPRGVEALRRLSPASVLKSTVSLPSAVGAEWREAERQEAEWREAEREEAARTQAERTEADGQGSTLDERVQPVAPAPSLDHTRLRGLVGQLVSGLMALHSAGKVHCDVKPANVLVTLHGRVVLVDFGLASEADAPKEAGRDGWRGTRGYVAPEVKAGHAPTRAGDWYAVGVMLREALTGERWPEHAPSSLVTSHDHLPADLAALCDDLLLHEPERRPTGRDILSRIGLDGPRQQVFPFYAWSSRPVRFVGRQVELSELTAAMQRARAHHTVVVAVEGPSGIGKTAVTQQFVEHVAASPDVLVLQGRCFEGESVPFKGLDAIVEALTRWLASHDDAAVGTFQRKHVTSMLRLVGPLTPGLPHLLGTRDGAAESSHDDDGLLAQRQRAFEALRSLLQWASRRVTLVVVLDDLQWCDADGAALLEYLLGASGPPPGLWLTTVRTGSDGTHAPAAVALQRLSEGSAGGTDVRRLTLRPLADAEIRELALAVAPAASGAAIADVMSEAQGLPVMARFLADRLRGDGTVGALVPVFQGMFSELPGDAQTLLEVTAVAASPTAQELLANAVGLSQDAASAAFDVLRSSALIDSFGTEPQDPAVVSHDRVRQLIRTLMPEARAAAHHARLARQLEARVAAIRHAARTADPKALVGPPRLSELEAAVRHYSAAGRPDDATRLAPAAAQSAESALAFERAADLYELSLTTVGLTAEQRGALLAGKARCLLNAGRSVAAGHAYVKASEQQEDEVERLRLRQEGARLLLQSGDTRHGLRLVEDVLAELNLALPREGVMGTVRALASHQRAQWRGLKHRRRSAASCPPLELIRLDAGWGAFRSLIIADESYFTRALWLHGRCLRLALDLGEPYRLARAIWADVPVLAFGGPASRPKVEKAVALAREMTAEFGDPYLDGLGKLLTATAEVFMFAPATTAELAQEAFHIFDTHCRGVTWERVGSRYMATYGALEMGDFTVFRHRLELALREGRMNGESFYERQLGQLQPLSLCAQDRRDDARRLSDQLLEARPGNSGAALNAVLTCGETALYLAEPEAAKAQLPRLLALTLQPVGHHLFYRQNFANVLGRLALLAAQDDRRYLKLASLAAWHLERFGTRLADGWAQLLRAQLVLARCGTHGRWPQRAREEAQQLLRSAEHSLADSQRRLWQLATARGLALTEANVDRARVAMIKKEIVQLGCTNAARMAAMHTPAFGVVADP